jgi:hypothetical protein
MPNPIKYSTGSETDALRKGNFHIGTGSVGKGPSDTTGYYQAVSPPSGGYIVYLNRDGAPGNLSYHNAPTDNDLIIFTNDLAGQSYTTVQECLVYYASQSDKVVLNRDYEGIVTDGLVLNLDAGFTPSYPRSGTTWYDVSSGGNNGTLINGPTFNSADGGSIVFDGVNDYADCGNNSSLLFLGTSPYTISTYTRIVNFVGNYPSWFDRESSSVGGRRDGYLLLYTTVGQLATNVYIFTERFSSSGQQVAGFTTSRSSIQNSWTYLATTYDGTNLKIYMNGELKGQSQSLGSIINNLETLKLAHPGFGNFNNCQMASVNVYNRALSAEELTQNYNAQKGRFGL